MKVVDMLSLLRLLLGCGFVYDVVLLAAESVGVLGANGWQMVKSMAANSSCQRATIPVEELRDFIYSRMEELVLIWKER